MTSQTLKYLQIKEDERSHRANEALKNRELENNLLKIQNDWLLGVRSNDLKELAENNLNSRELKKLAETVRSNLAREQETFRSNSADEAERYRHNVATENLQVLNQQLESDLTNRNNANSLRNSLLNIFGSMARGFGTAALGYALGKESGKGSKGSGNSSTFNTSKLEYLIPRSSTSTSLSLLADGANGIRDWFQSIDWNVVLKQVGEAGNKALAGVTAATFGGFPVYAQSPRSERKVHNRNERKRFSHQKDEDNEIPEDFSSSRGPGERKNYENIVSSNKAIIKTGYTSSKPDGDDKFENQTQTFESSANGNEGRKPSNVIYSPGSKTKGPGTNIVFS